MQSYSINAPIGLSNLLLIFLVVKKSKDSFVKDKIKLVCLIGQRYVISFNCARILITFFSISFLPMEFTN